MYSSAVKYIQHAWCAFFRLILVYGRIFIDYISLIHSATEASASISEWKNNMHYYFQGVELASRHSKHNLYGQDTRPED